LQTPAFSFSHIKSLSPVFWEKAAQASFHIFSTVMFWLIILQLRDIWLGIIDASSASVDLDVSKASPNIAPSDPFAHEDEKSGRTSGFLPNPFAAFVPSKAQPRAHARQHSFVPSPRPNIEADPAAKDGTAKIDVLAWLARATLDVIGEAGALILLLYAAAYKQANTSHCTLRVWLRF
jgi:hypothetical protein